MNSSHREHPARAGRPPIRPPDEVEEALRLRVRGRGLRVDVQADLRLEALQECVIEKTPL